jgi:hypothetical protein
LLEFHWSPPESSEPGPSTNVQASVRVRPTAISNLLIFFEAVVPSGYSLQATARGSGPDPIESHTSVSHSSRSTDYTSSWLLPASFGPEQVRAASAQLHDLAGRGVTSVILGEPRQLFSITNETGAVVQGFLELFGPPASGTL